MLPRPTPEVVTCLPGPPSDKALNYAFIPIMLKYYDPIKFYQISALCAICTTWCLFFYDQHSIDNWVNDIICTFRDQFILRVA